MPVSPKVTPSDAVRATFTERRGWRKEARDPQAYVEQASAMAAACLDGAMSVPSITQSKLRAPFVQVWKPI